MTTVNGVPFRQWLIPSSKYSIKAPYSMAPKKITLHNTDNQMPAHNEISYMRNNNNQVSYHVAIDEKEAIQGVPYNRNAWAAGDGANGYGNRNTVHIEICRNYDRTRKTTKLNEPLASQYSKAEQNTIKFVAQLCIDLGIVANNANIKTHNDWNGKWCPSKILNEGRLQLVKNAIIAEYNRLTGGHSSSSTSSNLLSGARLIKTEIGKFTATTAIKVRNAPNTNSTHTKTLQKNESITYNAVYEGNGYRWLQYIDSGSTRYVPYRPINDTKNQWGTFSTAEKIGWVKDSTGWWYRRADGNYPKSNWEKISGEWYLFDSQGYMQTGWQKVKDIWYYMGQSGAMQTGWLKDKDKWYYLDSRGAMQTGWLKDKGKWYYLDSSGVMQTGWVQIKKIWYYLDSKGVMQTGWVKLENKWYYLNSSGEMLTGLVTLDGKHYYLQRDGVLITDEIIKLEANKHGHLK